MMKQDILVEGMKFQGCANTVIDRFESLEGVESASVDLENKKATIQTSVAIDKTELDSVLEDTKYFVVE